MEEGSMRCDANISIRLQGDTKLGTRVEVKNLNSIRNVKRAIDVEVERLIGLVENNQSIIQETRSYDADNNITFSLRTKEDADDYRYFPEPDLTPFQITDDYLVQIKNGLPVLPNALKKHYTDDLLLSDYDASVLCDDKDQSTYFEEVIKYTENYKAVANWLLGPVKSHLNDSDITYKTFSLPAEKLAALIALVEEGKLNFGIDRYFKPHHPIKSLVSFVCMAQRPRLFLYWGMMISSNILSACSSVCKVGSCTYFTISGSLLSAKINGASALVNWRRKRRGVWKIIVIRHTSIYP
jgi:Asp-tRNA(Asn)/Glu-tRNA(Gln) amidotransferase B subunit